MLLLSTPPERQMVSLKKQPGPTTSAQKRGGERFSSDVDKRDLETVHEKTDAHESVAEINKWVGSCSEKRKPFGEKC